MSNLVYRNLEKFAVFMENKLYNQSMLLQPLKYPSRYVIDLVIKI